MDYGTLFFSNIVSMTVFTVCISLLALYNRRVVGMQWFAGGLIAGLLKLVLQWGEGHLPPVLSGMLELQLYLVSFIMQLIGLYWFVVRKPIQKRWPFIAVGLVLLVYAVLFLAKVRYSNNVINVPFVIVCAVSAWIVFKHRRGPFAAVSRVAAVVLTAETGVAAYRALLTNQSYARPWELADAKTDPRWLYSLAGMFFLATIMVMCYLWFLVTELQRELTEQARTDPLTGALNRRALEEAALREVSRSLRYGHLLCMIMVDVDHFKQLNDTRGHAAGDCALKAVVGQVKTMLRGQDVIARTGGEEFTILLPDTPASASIVVAERLRQAVEALEVLFESGPVKITISVGVSQFDAVHGGWEDMMRRADMAMYKAKEGGRNKVAVQMTAAPGGGTI